MIELWYCSMGGQLILLAITYSIILLAISIIYEIKLMEKLKSILKYVVTIGGWLIAACQTLIDTLQ